MTILYSHDFEDNTFSTWTGTAGSPTIQGTYVKTGTKAAKFTSSGALCSKTLGASKSSLFTSFDIYLPSIPADITQILHVYDTTFGYSIKLNINGYDSPAQWAMTNEGGSTTDSGVTLSAATWYHVEVLRKVGAGSGAITLFVNGTKIYSSLAETITNNSLYVQVGEPYADANTDVYIDNVKVSDKYIGISNTFGYNGIGALHTNTGGTAKMMSQFQLIENASISKITTYIMGAGNAKCAIYSDSASAPNALIGPTTQQVTVPASAAWTDFAYTTPLSLPAGYYWLVLIYDDASTEWYYDDLGTETAGWKAIIYTNEPINPMGSISSNTILNSIYATYTTGLTSFGNNITGQTTIGLGGSAGKQGSRFQLTVSASVSKITAYIHGTGNAKCVIYTDNAGAPNAPIGSATSASSVPASTGTGLGTWVDFTFGSPIALAAGYYWLTIYFDNDFSWWYDDGGTNAWMFSTYANEPTNPFSSHTDRTDLVSIYATYTESTISNLTRTINEYLAANKTGI
jgi:hypothetical protein